MSYDELHNILLSKRMSGENRYEIECAAKKWIAEEREKVRCEMESEIAMLKHEHEVEIERLSKPNEAFVANLKYVLQEENNEVIQALRDIISDEIQSLNVSTYEDHGSTYAELTYHGSRI